VLIVMGRKLLPKTSRPLRSVRPRPHHGRMAPHEKSGFEWADLWVSGRAVAKFDFL
jgi:hypothetical protein